jgi:hypothetical protein
VKSKKGKGRREARNRERKFGMGIKELKWR